ncbi:protein CHROMATIN REMODELING 20 isoform X2 [Euphorbia lathyris]|uniref:protein CHROMATIN REMODELING 20 isoform X2 n=1 Tax=Euphorbia lathyris TaxID=212925 RepID=UPI00331448EF
MEKNHEQVEDVEGASSDSFIVDSEDDDEPSTSGQDEGIQFEEPLTEKEIEELIAELLEVESKAAEAQEALEKESLSKVEHDVREELAQTLHGDDLEDAVEDEMITFKEEWETVLDELETESAHLLEQLDGAGIELPSLYKLIEKEAPNVCQTEAWKQRAHWVGSELTTEIKEAVTDAEKYLQSHWPVRRKHGKLLEEGASGFLEKKLSTDETKGDVIVNGNDGNVDWDSLKKLISGSNCKDAASFGSKHWAAVYLASTPQEAAEMGLKFPGVNEVEEIDDIDGNSGDPFIADAIDNEEQLLSEEQRKKYRKVKEEDDARSDRKLQLHLKQRRHHKRSKKVMEGKVNDLLPGCEIFNEKTHELREDVPNSQQPMDNGNPTASESVLLDFIEPRGSKRPNESEESAIDAKRIRTVITDRDGEADVIMGNSVGDASKVDDSSTLHSNIVGSGADGPLPQGVNGDFHCTVCENIAVEVHSHPLLKVIICKDCKCFIEDKLHVKDPECSECYCGWCGRPTDLVTCKSCKTLFCATCIKRNIGEEFLSKVQASGWNCCCCSPTQLQKLTSELEKALGSGYISDTSSDSESENSDADTSVALSKRRQKKKIRRILDDAELGEETQRKIAIEKERQERLKSLKVQFTDRSKMTSSVKCNGTLHEGASVEVLGDAASGYIVNVVREKGEEAVRIPPSISAKLKVHQVAGIRFMWENIIQTIGKVKSGDRGLGCILAHTMGLGKTFQVIAFLYTAMRSVDLGLKTALIVTPVNVLHNWRKEFMKWRPSELKPLRVFMLEDVPRDRRAELLAKWRAKGGVFIIGYSAFRNLSLGKHVKDKNMARELCHALQDGPDILVCDEAHMIKNTKADTTQSLKLVKCQRRIALTGSPLQNNLMEYYCMVDFVREGFLGSSHEFRNRFQNPIENGQHTNSTATDVKIMNQRSHILYEQLKGFVQRMDMSVVKKDLPPKTVFVISVKLSPLQRKLYKRFLDVHGFTKDIVSSEGIRKNFFAGYQSLAQIWNHPGILQLRKDRVCVRREENVDNFIADESSSDENVDYNTIVGEKPRIENDLQGKSEDGFFQKDWWNDLLQESNYKELDYSGKMVLLLDILTKCSYVGDKALVFSQSIPTLDLIEFYLSKLPRHGKSGKFWRKGKDWYRIDGRTESSERQRLVEKFNDPENKRTKCTLISTKAGSLGINLHAANRVVIVDGSWNPTYDLQAIYRAWRYGQKKPVFAYRLLAHGTMEEKIYKRQVTKEGLAARVVDRQQVHRTISREEMLHLFEFGDEISDSLTELQEDDQKQKVPSCSSDKFMETLLAKHHPSWIVNYHEHETLLQENEEEKLTKEEQDMAWEVYKRSIEWEEVQRVSLDDPMSERKPPVSNVFPSAPGTSWIPTSSTTPVVPEASSSEMPPSKAILRSRMTQRKCTNLSHLLTLRSQGTKVGCKTVCGECAQEISWEDLNKDGKMAR